MGQIRFVFVLAALTALHAHGQEAKRVMTDRQWRDDLMQLSSAIKDTHFKPFHNVSGEVFDAAVEELHEAIPQHGDAAIMVAMAQIVALLRDGHTRLHLPRLYPELAIQGELGHSGTPPPAFDELRLTQLPVRFGLFSDGVYVIGATPDYAELIGREVSAIGTVPIARALESVRSVSYFENDARAALVAPDRLALPEVLEALGIAESAERVAVSVAKTADEIRLSPLTGSGVSFVSGAHDPAPLWLQHRGKHHWYEVLSEQDAIFVQVNEFAEQPDRPYSDFVADTLTAAREAGVSRYIVDLRHNSGGTGAWVIPFLTGLGRSEFNEYGRLYVLMGSATFSAAQQFLHRFEEYTYAIFVGEPGGAKPSHFGDSRRIVLDNSGLTLRISTIYWHSWLANDFRDAIDPHIDAPLASADYFSGRDPGLAAALEYEPPADIGLQIEEQFRKGKNQNALILLQRYMTDATFADHGQAVPSLLKTARTLVDDGLVKPGYFVYLLTERSYPGTPGAREGMERARELMQ